MAQNTAPPVRSITALGGFLLLHALAREGSWWRTQVQIRSGRRRWGRTPVDVRW